MCSYMYRNDSAVILCFFSHMWMTMHVPSCVVACIG